MNEPQPQAGTLIEAATWRSFLNTLPAGARVLELMAPYAGESGPVALAALAVGSDARVETAQADDSHWSEPAHAGFNACAGEFVLDAGNAAALLPRIAAALTPGSECEFLVVHPQSGETARLRAMEAETHLVFADDGVFNQLRRLFVLCHAPLEQVEAVGNALQQAIGQLRQTLATLAPQGHGRFIAATLDAARQVMELRRQGDTPELHIELDTAESSLRAYAEQLQAQIASALDAEGIAELGAQASSAGFTRVEWQPATVEGELRGWQLLMHRP